METITAIEAVRRAIDPWGMSGQYTTAMRPTATDVIDRLAELGFAVTRAEERCKPFYPDHHPDCNESISDSEQRVLDGNR